jgi:hypothetical protein
MSSSAAVVSTRRHLKPPVGREDTAADQGEAVRRWATVSNAALAAPT